MKNIVQKLKKSLIAPLTSIGFLLYQPVLVLAVPYVTNCVPKTAVPFSDIGKLVGNVFSVALVLATILLFLYFVMGGIQWLTSGGDKAATQAARDRLTSALIGMLILLALWGVFRILEEAFGISLTKGINIPTVPTQTYTAGKTC